MVNKAVCSGHVPPVPVGENLAPSDLRIALYSHDTMGLGHKRRSLLIAQTLRQALPQCTVLLISGMAEASRGDLPAGIDYLTLPAWHKTAEGTYQARRLGVASADLALLRAKTIRAALETFNPHVFIVDNVPRGAMHELDLTLEFLRRRRHTRCILGLRDVLDDPATVHRQWQHAHNEAAIRRYYDAIWVYGDPTVYDLANAYHLPADIAAKLRYVGYLDAQARLASPPNSTPLPLPPHQPLALGLVGGGQDGVALATAFVQAPLPAPWHALLITGPLMPQADRHALQKMADQRANLTVLDYCPEPTALIQQAEAVIAMGGYNTLCEILSLGAKALIVPRTSPRREQWIRAQRLQQLGLIDVLAPDQLSPEAIATWLMAVAPCPAHPTQKTVARDRIDLKGLQRLPPLLLEVLATQPNPASPGRSWWPLQAS